MHERLHDLRQPCITPPARRTTLKLGPCASLRDPGQQSLMHKRKALGAAMVVGWVRPGSEVQRHPFPRVHRNANEKSLDRLRCSVSKASPFRWRLIWTLLSALRVKARMDSLPHGSGKSSRQRSYIFRMTLFAVSLQGNTKVGLEVMATISIAGASALAPRSVFSHDKSSVLTEC